MPANGGLCTEPCASTAGAVCTQATPTCVEAASETRCGGAAAVLSETFARPVDPERLEVLGVALSAPAVVGHDGGRWDIEPTSQEARAAPGVGAARGWRAKAV